MRFSRKVLHPQDSNSQVVRRESLHELLVATVLLPVESVGISPDGLIRGGDAVRHIRKGKKPMLAPGSNVVRHDVGRRKHDGEGRQDAAECD